MTLERQTGREQPWSTRRISHRHLHDQRNLKDLHLLTASWAPQGLVDPFEHEPTLEDDTSPEDVITRLEFVIREQQLRTIDQLRQEAPRLADLSFQAGQESAAQRWMVSDADEGSIAPADKRALLLALFHSPLAGRLGPDAFLVRRRLVTEVSIELLNCPHRQALASDGFTQSLGRAHASGQSHSHSQGGNILGHAHGVASSPTTSNDARDELCRQHFSWLRGYFNFLNPAIVPAYSRPRGRCVVSW